MKTLRKQTKSEVLLNLFEEIGTKIRVDDVCSITGIKNKNTLRSFCHYIRTSKHVAEENRIDIRISDGECIRVN